MAAFLAATDEQSTERTVYGVFGELAIPLTEDIDIQAALRFEDYGGEVGGSVDPKIAVSWRVTDELSVRGSASTTFEDHLKAYSLVRAQLSHTSRLRLRLKQSIRWVTPI